jgi:hypothetical protein
LPADYKIIGSVVVCPECRAQYRVDGDHQQQLFVLVPVSGDSP